MKMILRFLIGALGLWLATQVVDGFQINGTVNLLVAALLLGIVNAIVRPILFILTLPVTIITLGLFVFILNGISVALVAYVLPGVEVADIWAAVIVAIITGVISWVGQALFGLKEEKRD